MYRNFMSLTEEDVLANFRTVRDKLLSETDWTQIPDVSLTPETKTAWATYRQALRDMPDTLTVVATDDGQFKLQTLVWPEVPNE